ncbi:hypothetical protein AVEN_94462-1, partial [Araneus ventricosus]
SGVFMYKSLNISINALLGDWVLLEAGGASLSPAVLVVPHTQTGRPAAGGRVICRIDSGFLAYYKLRGQIPVAY